MKICRSITGHRIGECHQKSKLTDSQIKEMKLMYKPYVFGYKRLAKYFGCGVSTARDICTYRTRYNT